MNFPHLRARLFNTPLMARLEAAQHYAAFLDQLERGEARMPTVEGRVSAIDQARAAAYDVVDGGIAVLTVEGPLVQRAGQMNPDCSPITSYQWINAQLSAMADDPTVKAILLEFDSPGGEVANVFELGARISELSQTKPVWAVANEGAFSAGYALAAAADQLMLPATAMVGSIGVIMLHVDASRAIDKKGYTVTPIFAGARKNDFSSFEPLSREAMALGQARVDQLYATFVDYTAERRGMSADAVRATDAGVFGADAAVKMGLADGIATFDQTLAMLRNEIRGNGTFSFSPRRAGASTHATGDSTMAEQKKDAPAFTAEDVDKARAEARADAMKEASAAAQEASTAAAKAAQSRVAAILGHEEAQGRQTLAQHVAFNTTQSVDEAVALLKVSPKESAAATNALADAMARVPNPKVDAAGGSGEEAQVTPPIAANVYAFRREQAAKARNGTR